MQPDLSKTAQTNYSGQAFRQFAARTVDPPIFGMASQDSCSEELHQRISDDCKVHVLFEGTVTQEAIQKLIKYLNLAVDDYPTKKQPEEENEDDSLVD